MSTVYDYHIVYYCLVKCTGPDYNTREIVHNYFRLPSSTKYSSIIDKNLNEDILNKLVLNTIDFPSTDFDIAILNKKYIENYQIFVRNIPDMHAYQVVVSSKNTPKSLSIKLLEYLNTLNTKTVSQDIATFEAEYNAEVSKQIKQSVPDASKINNDMDQLISIMNDNIDKVLLRNDKLDTLVTKTNRLNNSGVNFKKKAVVLKRKMWFQNIKMKAIVGLVITGVIGGSALYATH